MNTDQTDFKFGYWIFLKKEFGNIRIIDNCVLFVVRQRELLFFCKTIKR